jgi:hypothetical protein
MPAHPLTRTAIVVLVLFLATQYLQSQSAVTPINSGIPEGQHFVCNAGYAHLACCHQTRRLAQQLTRYRRAVPPGWTWVLVRSRDWRDILLRLRLDSESPTFTVLERHQTFLSEALFEPDGESGAELLKTFRVPLDQLLDVAITHELGHAYCEESQEGKAERFAEQLRTGGAASCSPQHVPAGRINIGTLSVR